MLDRSDPRSPWLLGCAAAAGYALLVAIEAAGQDSFDALDLAGDAASLALIIATAAGVATLFGRLEAQRAEYRDLVRDLALARAEGAAWRGTAQAHLDGVKAEIERQFDAWGLTAAEREIGLLILKGLSHKEIATLRSTSDATVRQQAQAIYRKAKVPGRTAFAAYFLDDLMPAAMPSEDAPGSASRQVADG
jgi:DNA-binding NarL/FixJ family response regulator